MTFGFMDGLFEWVVMTFGLKNTGATYQRATSYIFHKLIDRIVEIYIDDVMIKSKGYKEHLADLRETLECTRKHGLKMNPNKCAFGVLVGIYGPRERNRSWSKKRKSN